MQDRFELRRSRQLDPKHWWERDQRSRCRSSLPTKAIGTNETGFCSGSKSTTVYYRNQKIELTTKEFNLLEYLMRHSNQVMTRDQILDDV